MEILQTIRKYFGYLAISPTKEKFNSQHILILILLLQFSLALLAFFLFTATQLVEYVDCFYGMLSAPANILAFLSYVWASPVIFQLITNLETTIQNRCVNPAVKAMYQEENDNANKFTRQIYIALVQITIPSIFFIHLFGSFLFYFGTDMGEDSFRLPFPIQYPFNLKTPIGFTVALAVTFLAFYVIGQSCACSLGLFSSMCTMIVAFILDLKNVLNSLDGKMQNLCNFVQLHSQAKQFVDDMRYIYQLIIPIYYVWSLLTICDNLLSIQIELVHDSGSPVIWISLTKVFWSFAQVFFVCYFGDRLTSEFFVLNFALYECDWYLLPIEMQQMLTIILSNSQRPVYLEGFGNVRCTLETFKNIVNGGFSYFMLLRQIEL